MKSICNSLGIKFVILLSSFYFSASSIARPDVGFPNSEIYVATEFDDNSENIKFTFSEDYEDYSLPDKFYSPEKLQESISQLQKKGSLDETMAEELLDMISSSFQSLFGIEKFLPALIRVLKNIE